MKTALESNRAWFIRTHLADLPAELQSQLVFSDDIAELEKSAAQLREREMRWKQEQADAHHDVADAIKRHGDEKRRERTRKLRRR